MTKFRKLIGAGVLGVILLFGGMFALAQNAGQFLSSIISTDAIQVYRTGTAAITYTTPGPLAGYLRGLSLLYTTVASVATGTGTTEQTLATYSLPANTLNSGTKIIIKASFTAAANGNNKTFKCYFGASVISSGVLTTNAKNGSCEVVATKTGASTQIVWGNMLVDTTNVTGYVNLSGTDTDTSAITIKFTGTDGTSSAADIVMNDFSVFRQGN